ncbi:coiled-coil domain-containing protein [Deinococcus multiflagellatus]|uniref:hypothetical protein n=1 Tax=Deinococcus multiflagellatus TaxID=1656887 RepID=UPI001CCA302A|nr:hypothetical protein [Deinococcus multiflagellatus]MBZ9714865.1 hypothetical protein [Deinococcus multiflagellatus]
MATLSRLPVKMLGDLVSPRALERILQDAAQARGGSLDTIDPGMLEDILKKEVFKRLQLSVPAPLAKKRVSEVLNEIMKSTQERLLPNQLSSLLGLEEGARRFSLYFDWPETQRLRGVLSVARQEEKEGRDISALVQEGQNLIDTMDRRLQEGLVEQGQDLAELRATFARVQGMGGKDVRRLDTLIGQIDEAQKQGTLLPGEVERARNLTFNLRKALESSVVQTVENPAVPTSATILDPDAQARVLALEQEHAAQQLASVEREFTALLQARPDLRERHEGLRALQAQAKLTEDVVSGWREALKTERGALLQLQREQFARLEAELGRVQAGADTRIALDSARHLLDSGSLATDELQELQAMHEALQAGVDARAQLELQRELLEIERSARNVPGASAELAPLLADARARLAQGGSVDPASLWSVLERRMGAAAQEREDFDARADRVVQEYDTVRHLAGETTQRLGRLADTLRAQRRLGQLSAQARERYAQTLADAEALLAEAHAEYRAAQEVTSTFGQDALSGLLDVFDFEESTPPLASNPDPTLAPPPPPPSSGGTPASIFDTLLSAPATPPTPAPAPVASAEPAETWTLEGGQIRQGAQTLSAQGMAALLAQATALGLHRLDMGDATHVWSARSTVPGEWRLGRAQNWTELDEQVGAWLDTGLP